MVRFGLRRGRCAIGRQVQRFGEEPAGGGIFHRRHFLGRSGGDEIAAALPAFRAEVDDVDPPI